MLLQVIYDCFLCALESSQVDAVAPISITFPWCRACACEHVPAAQFLFAHALHARTVLMLE